LLSLASSRRVTFDDLPKPVYSDQGRSKATDIEAPRNDLDPAPPLRWDLADLRNPYESGLISGDFTLRKWLAEAPFTLAMSAGFFGLNSSLCIAEGDDEAATDDAVRSAGGRFNERACGATGGARSGAIGGCITTSIKMTPAAG
jgi:hypothetical protein